MITKRILNTRWHSTTVYYVDQYTGLAFRKRFYGLSSLEKAKDWYFSGFFIA
jgi:hypothetical protein